MDFLSGLAGFTVGAAAAAAATYYFRKREQMKRRNDVQMVWENRVKELEQMLSVANSEVEVKNKALEIMIRDLNSLHLQYQSSNSSLAESEEYAGMTTEDNTLLDYEKLNLKDHIQNLQEEIELMHELLDKTQRTSITSMMTTLKQENLSLKRQVTVLQGSIEQLEQELDEIHRICYEKMRDCDQRLQAHSHLEEKYNELLQQKKTLPNINLITVLLKQQNKALMKEVKILEASVMNMERELNDARRKCDEKTKECEEQRQAHSLLRQKYNEMEFEFQMKGMSLEVHNELLIEMFQKKRAMQERLYEELEEANKLKNQLRRKD